MNLTSGRQMKASRQRLSKLKAATGVSVILYWIFSIVALSFVTLHESETMTKDAEWQIISNVILPPPLPPQYNSNATSVGACGQLSEILLQKIMFSAKCNKIQEKADVPKVAQKQEIMLVVGVQAVMEIPTDDQPARNSHRYTSPTGTQAQSISHTLRIKWPRLKPKLSGWGVQMMLSLLEVLHQLPAPLGEEGVAITWTTAGPLGHNSVGALCAQHAKETAPLGCVTNSYYPLH